MENNIKSMNAKNHGNKIITYTVITLNDSMFESCMKVVGYLVSKGHKVTVLSDQTLEKQVEDTSVFAEAIAGSDITIIFCNDYADGYPKDFVDMVKATPNTCAVVVFPSNEILLKRIKLGPENRPAHFIAQEDIFGMFGSLRQEKVDYLLCNPALYQ